MKRALFVHSTLHNYGGGDGVTAWMLQALQAEYKVTLLTWRPVDFEALNAHFGTSLREEKFRILYPCLPVRWLIQSIPDEGTIQKFCYLLRIAKRLAPSYDVLLTAEMEADFGTAGIQYVHFPYLRTWYPRALHSLDMPLAGKLGALLRGRIRPWMMLADFSFARMGTNLTLVNSDWTGRCYQAAFGAPATTLYPPAAGDFPNVPFEERENGFVSVGRFHPCKRADWAMETLAEVHAEFPDVRLHLVGVRGPSSEERKFYARLTALARTHSSWVRMYESISRRELVNLLSRQKYGIHAMVDEHFGMGIAEMVRAGCVPFLHESGGQVEIVGNQPALLYRSAREAVERILAVLRNPGLQNQLHHDLSLRANLFTPEAFTAGFRRVVEDFLATKAQPVSPILS